MADIKPGDRVKGTFYGVEKTGTVAGLGERSNTIVFVAWDNRPSKLGWTFKDSLEPINL